MLITPYTTQAITLIGAPTDTQRLLAHRDQAMLLGTATGPLAAFTTWRNPMHPYLLNFTFALTAAGQAYDQAELADALLSATTARAKALKARGLITRTTATTTPLISAMVSRGLRRVRTTFNPVLSLATAALPSTPLPVGTTLHSSTALAQQPALRDALLTRTYEAYALSHRINPVAPYNAGRWAAVILDDLVADVPLLLTHQGELKAYCLIYAHDAQQVDFGYAWGADADWLAPLAEQTISSLSGLYQTLNGEFDDTDPGALQVARLFPAATRTDNELAAYTLVF
ncbi:hypothetical protein [Lacticaseibacillus absianus]|uniref:hypothetical protein n=1 Tax=Lacticaseibacillus absianus TaxID=2729623 RepID=UPI0015CB3D1F|nr:hypothetical protein [Lacticaseibacillus absianus]